LADPVHPAFTGAPGTGHLRSLASETFRHIAEHLGVADDPQGPETVQENS